MKNTTLKPQEYQHKNTKKPKYFYLILTVSVLLLNIIDFLRVSNLLSFGHQAGKIIGIVIIITVCVLACVHGKYVDVLSSELRKSCTVMLISVFIVRFFIHIYLIWR